MIHELKTDPDVFQASYSGQKSFEIRRNDRNFCAGDRLMLRETQHTGQEMRDGAPLKYTGRAMAADVLYIMHGPAYGLMDGWCIMSIQLKVLYN